MAGAATEGGSDSEGGDVCVGGVSLLYSLQSEELPYFLFYTSGIGSKILSSRLSESWRTTTLDDR